MVPVEDLRRIQAYPAVGLVVEVEVVVGHRTAEVGQDRLLGTVAVVGHHNHYSYHPFVADTVVEAEEEDKLEVAPSHLVEEVEVVVGRSIEVGILLVDHHQLGPLYQVARGENRLCVVLHLSWLSLDLPEPSF